MTNYVVYTILKSSPLAAYLEEIAEKYDESFPQYGVTWGIYSICALDDDDDEDYDEEDDDEDDDAQNDPFGGAPKLEVRLMAEDDVCMSCDMDDEFVDEEGDIDYDAYYRSDAYALDQANWGLWLADYLIDDLGKIFEVDAERIKQLAEDALAKKQVLVGFDSEWD